MLCREGGALVWTGGPGSYSMKQDGVITHLQVNAMFLPNKLWTRYAGPSEGLYVCVPVLLATHAIAELGGLSRVFDMENHAV